jgi:alpha-mannosidase
VRLVFDEGGAIASLLDKTSRRDVVARGRLLNQFQAFRDEPAHWEAWDIDPDYQRKPVEVFGRASVQIVEHGPVRWRARVTLRSRGRTRLEQDVIAYAGSPAVRFVTRAWWHERRTLLKVAFPLALGTTRATYEIPFGAIARPTTSRALRDRARWEVAGQQWADLSERRFGVSLLNDCKYGYDCAGTVLRLTLIRSPRYPHHAEPMTRTSGRFTDQGEHRFTYVLMPHAGTWREAGTARHARELNVGCLLLEGRRAPSRPAPLRLAAPNLQVSAIAPGSGPREVFVRVYEAHGLAGPAPVDIAWPCDDLREVDLTGRTLRRHGARDGRLMLRFRPFEIKTLCLTPAPWRSPRGGTPDAD